MPEAGTSKRRLPGLSAIIFAGAILGLVALIVLPPVTLLLKRLEHQTADWRTAVFSDRLSGPHPDVAVVLIDEATLDGYPYLLPPDRGLMAKIIKALDEAGAKVIGIDFYFARRTEPEKDAALIAALKGNANKPGATIVLGALDERGRLTGRQKEVQSSFLAEADRLAGYLNLRTEPDGVVRYLAGPAKEGSIAKSLVELVGDAFGTKTSSGSERIAWLKPPATDTGPFLTLNADALLAGTPAHDAAVARGDIAKLKGRAVLVGGDIAYLDRHVTPMSAVGGGKMIGVFVHAHMLAQLIDGRAISELSLPVVRVLLAGLAAVGAFLGWRLGADSYNLIGWTTATAVLVAADAVIFSELRIILPFTLMLVAWVLGAAAGQSLKTLTAGRRDQRRLET